MLAKEPPPSHPVSPKVKQNSTTFRPGPSISIKRGVPAGSEPVLGSKHFKTADSEDESKRRKKATTVTLDETVIIVDTSDDEKDNKPGEIDWAKYDDCPHGEMTDYMCMDCTYKRWECEWDTVKPPQVRPKSQGLTLTKVKVTKPAEHVQVNPAEIMQAVNWQKVFKFAGVEVKRN